MWPFNTSRDKKMNYRTIDANFAVAGQVLPEQVRDVAAAGFKTIVCARPDNEEPGQPSFKMIEAEAEKLGLKAVYIPISGGISESAQSRMAQALKDLPKPMYGYCRSGARAGSLYNTALAASR
ncbi:aminotransferase class V [Youhaiella tibetensis]|nr:aminotransferase class V [Youhaiella tibetensis]